MKIKELINILDSRYDFKNQEEWDQCGVLKELNVNQENEVNKVLVSLDITVDLIIQAIKTKANVIITHHPIYVGLYEEQENQEWIDKVIELLNKNNIIHIALHTCYDMYEKGTSFQIIRHLFDVELDNIKRLENNKYCDYIQLTKPIKISKLVKQLNKSNLLSNVRYLEEFSNIDVQTIGIVGGSGFSELKNILNSETKIDCLLTGDVKWHNFIDSHELNYPVIDIGHDAEWLGMYGVYSFLHHEYSLDFKTELQKPIKLKLN